MLKYVIVVESSKSGWLESSKIGWLLFGFVLYRDTRTKIIQIWMIIAYHKIIIQIWMITDGQKSSIFGTGPYLVCGFLLKRGARQFINRE